MMRYMEFSRGRGIPFVSQGCTGLLHSLLLCPSCIGSLNIFLQQNWGWWFVSNHRHMTTTATNNKSDKIKMTILMMMMTIITMMIMMQA